MSVPNIAVMRTLAADIIAKCARGQMDAIEAGAIAAAATGSPLSPASTAQQLVTECQPLIDQADSDAQAIRLRYLLAFLANPTVPQIGVDGDGWVFKNGNGWLRFDDGLYRKNVGYIVEGQPQGGYENTGYPYNSIP